MLPIDEFYALFEGLKHGAWRLLTLDGYNVSEDERARRVEWERTGRVPDRTGEPWLRMVADYTAAGVPFARVHVFPGADRLPSYCEYVLESYEWNDAAGERVSIADRQAHPELDELDHDFWVLDDRVVVIQYEADRDYAGAYVATEPEATERIVQQKLAIRTAVPLAEYKAARRERLTA